MPDLILLILMIIISAFSILHILFYTLNNHTFNKYRKANQNLSNEYPAVSVIIAAKNEIENLKKHIESILEQDYPEFELIVINDGSTDLSSEFLEGLLSRFSNLRIISIEKSKGKKNALKEGILNAKNEILLFTDADCYAKSRFWIKSMIECLSKDVDIVLGYGAYLKGRSFIEKFVMYDAYIIALQYFSASIKGRPYMGVGRNLLYRKSIWLKNNGFESHKSLLSGDDDLFIKQAATGNNSVVCLSDDSFTYSIPSKTFKEFIRQKSRHISTSGSYSNYAKLFTSIDTISRSIIYLLSFLLLFTPSWWIVLMLLALRLLLVYIVSGSSAKALDSKIGFHYFILFDIFAPVFYLLVLINNRFIYKAKTW